MPKVTKKKGDLKKLKKVEVSLSSKSNKSSKVEVAEIKRPREEEFDEEDNLNNFIGFFDPRLLSVGSGVLRGPVLDSENRSLEGSVGGVQNAPEAANLEKEKQANVNPYVTNSGIDYTIRLGQDFTMQNARKRRNDDMDETVLTARRKREERAFIQPEERALNVGDFRREMTQQGGSMGADEYSNYVVGADKLQYESGLPFEQKEEKRKRF
ncbi:MAG: hypothetical protein WC796_03770 [Candidatus Pacearchaeota archaeon]|jgi:hypothetical protein